MIDCFALLQEPRRPWLNPEALRQKFLELSASLHPDRVHGAVEDEKRAAQEHYTQLNAAYQCLREPKDRLRHLLELERGAKPEELQSIPPDLLNLGFEVGQLCRQTDAFLAEKAKVSSPLLQVQMFERGQEWTAKLQALQATIGARLKELMAEIKAIDAEWDGAQRPGAPDRQTTLGRLEELYRLCSYFTRWSAQIQERIVQLAF